MASDKRRDPPDSGPSLRGRLIVANPAMTDDNFARSIVLMLEHGDSGALGLILNRPSQMPASEILPALQEVAVPPGTVHLGGPVSPSSAICLGRARPGAENDEIVTALFGVVCAVDLDADLDRLGAVVDGVRLFAGYAGWSPGQLDAEMKAGGWFAVDRLDADIFTSDPEGLWRSVLRRQRVGLSLLANFPEDPSAN